MPQRIEFEGVVHAPAQASGSSGRRSGVAGLVAAGVIAAAQKAGGAVAASQVPRVLRAIAAATPPARTVAVVPVRCCRRQVRRISSRRSRRPAVRYREWRRQRPDWQVRWDSRWTRSRRQDTRRLA
jgi:hypothetical protein